MELTIRFWSHRTRHERCLNLPTPCLWRIPLAPLLRANEHPASSASQPCEKTAEHNPIGGSIAASVNFSFGRTEAHYLLGPWGWKQKARPNEHHAWASVQLTPTRRRNQTKQSRIYVHILHQSIEHQTTQTKPNAVVTKLGWSWNWRSFSFSLPNIRGSCHKSKFMVDGHISPISQWRIESLQGCALMHELIMQVESWWVSTAWHNGKKKPWKQKWKSKPWSSLESLPLLKLRMKNRKSRAPKKLTSSTQN